MIATTWELLGAGAPPAPSSTTSTTLDEHQPHTLKVGANTDSSDFFGIGIAIVVLIIAVVVIKVAFPTRRRPGPPPVREGAEEPEREEGG